MAKTRIALEEGNFYHIYNRGIDGIPIFRKCDNYRYFLELYTKHCYVIAETYAYCLLSNHFHLLVRIRENLPNYATLYPEIPPEEYTSKAEQKINPSRQFSHFFNAYAQGFNKMFDRKGSLFTENFERKWVDNKHYFTHLVQYIHQNPVRHGFTKQFDDYPHSSYHSHLSGKKTLLERDKVQNWFGNEKEYTLFHKKNKLNEKLIEPLIIEFD